MIFGQRMQALPIDWKQPECLGWYHSISFKFQYYLLLFIKFDFVCMWLLLMFFSSLRKVHITQQTLELLEDRYFFEPGTEMAKNDPILKRNNIETFLISPQYYGSDSHVSFCIFMWICAERWFKVQFVIENVCTPSITVQTSWIDDFHRAWSEWWADRHAQM